MATYHHTSTTPRRVLAHAGLEVLTNLDQHHSTARAAPEGPTDWGNKVSPPTSRTGSLDTDVSSHQSTPDHWHLTEEHPHQATHHRQQSTAGCSYNSGDRSPVAALEERVRELQAVLVHLGKDLRDLEQTGCSCQDQASQLPSPGQSRSCSWCRTKSKLGVLRREISTRAKKAFGIPRKQDRVPASDIAAALDIPAPHNSTEPQTPLAVHKPCSMGELPEAGRMFELENAEEWPRWELVGSQTQMDGPTFAPHDTTAARPPTRARPLTGGSFYSSFSDGFTGGPIQATPSRPSNQCSMVSTSSSSFRGSDSWVTPQSSRSNTSNSVPLIYTGPRTVIAHDGLCESPTTLEPGLGTNGQRDVPPWGRNTGLWGSTSTLADDTGDIVNNVFSDHQWKGPTDRLYTSDSGNIFDYSSTKGKDVRVDTEFHGPPPVTSFGTPQNTRNGSWGSEVFELACPSTSRVFPPAATEAGVYPSWESKGGPHGLRQARAAPRNPSLRSTTREDFGRPRDGLSILTTLMSSPLNSLATFPQPLMDRNVALAASHFHTYPPIGASVPFQLYEFEVAPEYPPRIPRTPRPSQIQNTVIPQRLTPLPPAATSPQLPEQGNPPGSNNRQSSLVGVGCKPCGVFPTGRDPRKAMKRHKGTDRHRRRTGQVVVRRILCPVPGADGISLCGRKFSSSRRDNLGQHVRKDHGGLTLEDCGPIRYELEDEDEVEMWDA